MIVQRSTWKVKRGSEQKMIDLLAPYLHDPQSALKRIYRPYFLGTFGVIVGEFEYQSLAELEEDWAAFFADPETVALAQKWSELVDSDNNDDHSEVWRMVEIGPA